MGPILSYDSISHDMSWNFGLKLKFVLCQKEVGDVNMDGVHAKR